MGMKIDGIKRTSDLGHQLHTHKDRSERLFSIPPCTGIVAKRTNQSKLRASTARSFAITLSGGGISREHILNIVLELTMRFEV